MTKIATELTPPKPASAAGSRRPTRAQAEEAVRTLLAWAGDDPHREGLRDTPRRVVEAYGEYFAGYGLDPVAILREPLMDDIPGFSDMVIVRNIRVTSHCEHHVSPFEGRANIAYVPAGRLVGLSRFARAVDALARRLQTQEALTAQITAAIDEALAPRGTAVMIEAEHHCMTSRGVMQPGTSAVTTGFTGVFQDDATMRQRFLQLVEAHTPPR